MLRSIAQKAALLLAMTILAGPLARAHAQTPASTPTTNVVTGGDPQPTGEPPPPPKKTSATLSGLALAVLIAVGLA